MTQGAPLPTLEALDAAAAAPPAQGAVPAAPPPETITVVDAQGRALQAPPGEAEALLKSGQFGLAGGQDVVLDDGAGGLRVVSAEEAARAFATPEGALLRLGSRAAFAEQELAREYQGVGAGLKAAAAGAARGLTFGASDVALGADEEVRQELANLQRYRPGASTAGELAGAVAPALMTGGTSAEASIAARAARGATALSRGVATGAEAVGAVASRGVARVAGESLLSRAAGQAARFGVEGAAQAAGTEVSRAALANEELQAEKIMAAAGHGFLWGAAGGAALAGVGAVAQKATGAALDAATSAGEAMAGRTSAREASTLSEKATKLADTLSPGGLEAYAESKVLKGTGANQKLLSKLEEQPARIRQKMVDQIREQLPELVGKQEGAALSRIEAAEAATRNADRWGKRVGDALDQLDALGTVRPDVGKVVESARKEVLEKLTVNPFLKSEAKQVGALIDALEQGATGAGFRDLHAARRALDESISWGSDVASAKAKKQLRALIETELEQAAQKAGGEVGAAYKAAKDEYRAAVNLRDATAKGAEREAANASFGFSEQVTGGAAANVGAQIGTAVAGPVGGFVGGALGGLVGAYGSNLRKRFGDQLMGELLTRAAKGDVVSALASGVDDVMGARLAKFFGTSTPPATLAARVGTRAAAEVADQVSKREERKRAASPADTRREFARARATVQAAAASTPAATARTVAGLEQVSPTLAAKTAAVSQRAVTFLQSKVPTPQAPAQTLTPQFSRNEVSATEQAKFLRYYRAVDDPTSVLEDLERGSLSREGVEALRVVYPHTYQQLQTAVTDGLTQLDKPLSWEQGKQLSLLLGVPARPAFSAEFIASQQASFDPLPPDEPPARPPSRNVDTARLYALPGEEP